MVVMRPVSRKQFVRQLWDILKSEFRLRLDTLKQRHNVIISPSHRVRAALSRLIPIPFCSLKGAQIK